ncbi:breast cancer anti-estrogen resistance protein 1 [Aplysia californica]|uniref:Breast cancer anti-estrogen resistance protein 1 n=1 Tax=Aplysia californica TaxID=6500 RepID=A0ABM1A4W1_APLCA|nr:breast cancer anti-estrogen resistance protein 1 [Aplysia californica]
MTSLLCGIFSRGAHHKPARSSSVFYLPLVGQSGMELYDQPSRGQQDYDVPPVNRGSVDSGGGGALSSRRPSRDSLRSSGGSRAASLGDDLYDTPPSSKRGSAETAGGLYDTPPSSKRASSERTPPHSNRSSASRESGGSNLLTGAGSGSQLSLSQQHSASNMSLPTVVRRRSGSHCSENCYETPPGSNRSSLERILSEEGPPIYDTLSPAISSEQLEAGEATYDTPPTRTHTLSQANPASQMSLHSACSSESLLSNTSGVSSAQLSHSASLPDSARSSMDLPAETYDVPPSLQDGEKSRKQLSTDSGLGFYDSPVKSRPSSSTPRHSSDGLKSSQSSFDCKPSPGVKDIKRSKSLEHALDDLYDVPKNNAPKINLKKSMTSTGYGSNSAINDPSGVYDIPPQVTRDSVISMRSDSSDENQRFSSSSLDLEQHLSELPLWDELLLDVDSALEVLVKRQQDVNKATGRLAGFVNGSWRSRASLEKTLYDIKVSCSLVKNSLHDYVSFSHGAVANAAKYADRQLAMRLNKLVSPLQSTLEFVKRSYANLEDMKWQVSLLAEPLDKTKSDDLGQIALVAKDLMPEVKKVSAFIQGNSSFIFRKSPGVDSKKAGVLSKPPIGPKAGEVGGGRGGLMSGYVKPKNMQHRPLPAVPGSEKPNSPSVPSSSQPVQYPKPKMSMYDIKAELHKDDYAECDDLPEVTDSDLKDVMEQCVQEYDYVQLDARDSPPPPPADESKTTGLDTEDSVDGLVAGEEVRTPTNKNSQEDSKVEETGVSNVANRLAGLSVYDADVDMVPVRDSGAGEPVVAENVASLGELNNSSAEDRVPAAAQSEGCVDSDNLPEPTSPESDQKTPVNVESSEEASNFILPSASQTPGEPEPLDPNDRQVLAYYTDQINTHSTLLANAIDAFIGVVGSNQPPNVFISHGKFVIVSAHKLVYIGDSIHRNLISNSISTRIMHCANNLCDCLKASVTATKTAALQYPSVPAVQDMVNKVIAVSHAAQDLKHVITQSVK